MCQAGLAGAERSLNCEVASGPSGLGGGKMEISFLQLQCVKTCYNLSRHKEEHDKCSNTNKCTQYKTGFQKVVFKR